MTFCPSLVPFKFEVLVGSGKVICRETHTDRILNASVCIVLTSGGTERGSRRSKETYLIGKARYLCDTELIFWIRFSPIEERTYLNMKYWFFLFWIISDVQTNEQCKVAPLLFIKKMDHNGEEARKNTKSGKAQTLRINLQQHKRIMNEATIFKLDYKAFVSSWSRVLILSLIHKNTPAFWTRRDLHTTWIFITPNRDSPSHYLPNIIQW